MGFFSEIGSALGIGAGGTVDEVISGVTGATDWLSESPTALGVLGGGARAIGDYMATQDVADTRKDLTQQEIDYMEGRVRRANEGIAALAKQYNPEYAKVVEET